MIYLPPVILYNKEIHEANPVGIDYLVRNERARNDHTNKIPNKQPHKERLPWGFYGYTYLQHNEMWINELLDFSPELKKETEVHEAIHTDNEYETRVVSRDMVKKEGREEIIRRIIQTKLNYN